MDSDICTYITFPWYYVDHIALGDRLSDILLLEQNVNIVISES